MQGKSIIFVIGGIGLVDGFFPYCYVWHGLLQSVYAMSVFTLGKKDCCGRIVSQRHICVCVFFFPFLICP